MKKEILTEFEAGERLDKAVAVAYPDYSRSSIEKLIESGDILVNGQVTKAKYKLKPSDKISADFSSLNAPIADIELPIIYEDKNVVVINKPSGVLVHSKGIINNEPTVASWLNSKYGNKSSFWQSNRAGIVHRLDRVTSGVMICAKNEQAQKFLQKQFAKRNVKKTYTALAYGHLKTDEANIDLPIGRNPKKPQTFRVDASGKSAITAYRLIKRYRDYDSIELTPLTGRTHQLRVHLHYLDHPIVGDHIYQSKSYRMAVESRLFLHAKSLEITLPDSSRQIFTAELPDDLKEVLTSIG